MTTVTTINKPSWPDNGPTVWAVREAVLVNLKLLEEYLCEPYVNTPDQKHILKKLLTTNGCYPEWLNEEVTREWLERDWLGFEGPVTEQEIEEKQCSICNFSMPEVFTDKSVRKVTGQNESVIWEFIMKHHSPDCTWANTWGYRYKHGAVIAYCNAENRNFDCENTVSLIYEKCEQAIYIGPYCKHMPDKHIFLDKESETFLCKTCKPETVGAKT